MTRSKLESLVADLLKRSIDPCKTALKDAGLSSGDVDEIILVGGQTRMPKVQQMVKDFFGKEQSITIKSSSGLSDEEVDKMIKDAEAHADEDKKFQELVSSRNMADSLVHSTKQSLEELKDEISDDEKSAIEGALTELEESIKGDDKEVIDAKVQNLSEKAQVLAQKAQEKAGAEGSAEASSDASDDVVDADFEEVNEEK